MNAFLRAFWIPLVLVAAVGFEVRGEVASSRVRPQAQSSNRGQHVSLVIRTDRRKYSPTNTVKLDVSLHNTGDGTIYVDRRMFWGGIGSGLDLEVRNQQGKR